jgi:hypothetical protein
MDEQALREKARAALRDGRIPARRQDKMWSGRVSGQCAVCGLPVNPEELEFEILFGSDKFQLHDECLAAWEFERTQTPGPPA